MDGAIETVQIAEVLDLGVVVQKHRRAAGMTQVEAARRAGVGPRFYGELENGKVTVRLENVLKVLAGLGLRLLVAQPSMEEAGEGAEC
jgi:HTH-type transcriptional regulator / antitoxin HipB